MASEQRTGRLFLGCFFALVATAFGFAVRSAVLGDWEVRFNLTEEQKGIINGVGLYPFAISIILFSLIVDRVGYRNVVYFGFFGHLFSAVLTIFAPNFETLYIATFIYALANGTVEAVINPVVATIYKDNKTHWLNVLHAGWPAGLVLAGLLSIIVLRAGDALGTALPGEVWQWQMAVLLIPTLVYGVLLFGQKFPVQERVEAGASYREMLGEFGWGSAYIVSFLVIGGISQVLSVFGFQPISVGSSLLYAILPAAVFATYVRSFGRPIFVFLLLVMILLATTELGTDGWIQDIMGSVLGDPVKGTLFFIYTASIMFVLRFFAGPIVHRISPLGLLAVSSGLAACGLLWLGFAGPHTMVLLLAATLYACGKTFFWPTTLGVVSEQYPRGGALLLNAISGVGMIAVGTIGGPAIGTLQDIDFNNAVRANAPAVHEAIAQENTGAFFDYESIDQSRYEELSQEDLQKLTEIERGTKQRALAKIALLPLIMLLCYVALYLYYNSIGGYKASVLVRHEAEDEQFTGGVTGPIEG